MSTQIFNPTSLGKSSSFSPHAYTRYTSHFGAPNFEVSLANHTLIMFDAPSYADEDAKRHGQKKSVEEWVPIPGGSLEFMKKFTSGKFRFTAEKNAVFLCFHLKLHIQTLSFCSVISQCIDMMGRVVALCEKRARYDLALGLGIKILWKNTLQSVC